MTEEDIEKMKQTKTLILSRWEVFWHYSILTFLLLPPIVSTVDVFKYYVTHTYNSIRPIDDCYTNYIWLIPAIAFYFIQKKRLKFKVINATVNSTGFKKITQAAATKRHWKFIHQTDDYVEAFTGQTGGGSWGERITIIRDNDRILINSICDPDNRPSVTSFGKNRSNVVTFERQLAKYQEQIIS